MHPNYIPIELDDGSIVYFQSINVFSGEEVPASGNEPTKATEVLGKAMSSVMHRYFEIYLFRYANT